MKPIADALRPPEPAAPAEDAPRLLDSVVAHSSAAADPPCPPAQVQGVALGRLGGIDANGGVLVSIEAWKLHDIPARARSSAGAIFAMSRPSMRPTARMS